MILDVWENEPQIDVELLRLVEIGTPHIAGYSYDGKINGTRMIYETACQFFDKKSDWDSAEAFPVPIPDEIQVAATTWPDEQILYQVIKQIYDIELDDSNLRGLYQLPGPEQGAFFDNIRKSYRSRREFYTYRLNLSVKRPNLVETFGKLGFKINSEDLI
jgi:erythronate-4-phosphate dehydrogenase